MRATRSTSQPRAVRRNLQERFLPALRSQTGFVAGYWGEAADDRSVSITIWESEEAMRLGAERANAIPLRDWQDPALIASPEHSDLFTISVEAERHTPLRPSEDSTQSEDT